MKRRDGQLPEITVKCQGHSCNQCDIMCIMKNVMLTHSAHDCVTLPLQITTSNGFKGYQHASTCINNIVCSEPGRHTSGWQRSRAGTKCQNRECIQHNAAMPMKRQQTWKKNRKSVRLGTASQHRGFAAPSLDHENSSRSGASLRAKHLIAFPGPIISRSVAFCCKQMSKLAEFRDAKVHKICIKCNTHLYQFAEPPHHREIQRALSIPIASRSNIKIRKNKFEQKSCRGGRNQRRTARR